MCIDDKRTFFSQFSKIIELLDPCVDNFLYVKDLQNDYYYISPSATERFNMDKCEFGDVTENHRKFVHPADFDMLNEEMDQILSSGKTFHNLQYRWLDKNKKPVWINCRGRVTLDEEGNPEFMVGCINEIGKVQEADNISGLLREASLQQEIEKCGEERMSGFFMLIGIDNFKEINENCGIEYGDMILRRTAECIQAAIEPNQKLYRIVADEYAIMDFSGRTTNEARALYYRIRAEIDKFIEENGYEVFYTISAGILKMDDLEQQNYDSFVTRAEFALSEAKNRGKNRCYVYSQEDYEAFLVKRKRIQVLRKAVNRDFEGFEAYFQPIVDITNNKLTSAEALMRFSSEETGRLSPAEFIPLLEESGLIIPVGRWMLNKALEACSKVRKIIPDFRVAVNISYIQILKSDIVADIRANMKEYQLEPGSVVVELTESGYLDSEDYLNRFFERLKDDGILVALDDFGTGYSNFQYLYNISPDTIKIDRSFTIKALKNPADYKLLQHMVYLAHSIQLKLCVEGIETKEELDEIAKIEPDYIQGYYFGKPCSFDIFWDAHVASDKEETD